MSGPRSCPSGQAQVVLEPVQSQTHGGLQKRIQQRHLLGGVTGLVDEGTEDEGGEWDCCASCSLGPGTEQVHPGVGILLRSTTYQNRQGRTQGSPCLVQSYRVLLGGHHLAVVPLHQVDASDLMPVGEQQSGSPSHFQLSLTHSPLAQRNSPAVQLGTPSPPQRSGPSSELSEQSGSPSQLHMSGTHSEVLQRRWLGPQVRGDAHLSSSLPSPQSSSPSHT
ncbi:hypothetical protein EYF80_008282 [Liparis tanakae]|uniref:Uncharacterized protein n=1 Tax=Liparis tanakae TaxID=230148 RepID=A0A4Z2IU50_9TELE|nr:hypothetical protein EYF80_008282 [Liparis tanakae]